MLCCQAKRRREEGLTPEEAAAKRARAEAGQEGEGGERRGRDEREAGKGEGGRTGGGPERGWRGEVEEDGKRKGRGHEKGMKGSGGKAKGEGTAGGALGRKDGKRESVPRSYVPEPAVEDLWSSIEVYLSLLGLSQYPFGNPKNKIV
jgi:hypothetical protein